MHFSTERRNHGEMGLLTRAFDWASTCLGPAGDWPQSLKTAVGMLLNSNHPMFLWWGPELIQFYNDAYRKTLGPERHSSALGQPGRECWQDIWPIIGPQVESVLGGGPSTWHEDQLVPLIRHGSRQDVWWTYGYSAIPDDGAVGGVIVVCTDVTEAHVVREELVRLNERLRMEVALRRHESERLALLFEQAPGFMCILRGPEHVFEFANQAYRRLIGHRELIGKTVRDAIPEAEGQGFFEQLDRAYQTGQAFFAQALPIELQQRPGAPLAQRFLDFVYQPIIEEDGAISGIFVQGADMTERQAAEHQLQDSNRRKDEFLAMLAHELRNPLAPISAAAQFLKLARLDEEKVRNVGQIIGRQALHMTGLIDDLLDISRVSRGQVSLDRQSIDIRVLLDDAIEQVLPLIEARQHQLKVQQPTESLRVFVDCKRVVQVLANLLNNAAKYTSRGGHLAVSIEGLDDQVVLAVKDDGSGIEPDLLPHVFELFTQAARTPDRSQGGLGIGLSLVKGIVELHGGSVTAQSAGVGAGTQVTVSLPRHPDVQPAEDAKDVTRPMSGKGLRILIVDDNQDAATMMCLCLAAAGHDVITEVDSLRAFNRVGTDHIDVCVLDIGLPRMDGNELARRIRAAPIKSQPLLIAVTGYGRRSNRKRSMQAGFDHYFVKPANTEALIALLATRRVSNVPSSATRAN